MIEQIKLSGRLFVYEGRASISQHLVGSAKPTAVIDNMMPTAGRAWLMGGGSLSDIDAVKIGDDATARQMSQTDLFNSLFSASPTSFRVVDTKRVTELFVGVGVANFTHREIGIFAGSVLVSTLVIDPEFTKDVTKTRTYIHEMGWL